MTASRPSASNVQKASRSGAPGWRQAAPTMAKDEIILVNLSGRGDKDIFTAAAVLGVTL